jgi:YggT family protein
MSSPIALIATSLAGFLQIYFVMLIARILLSWFPNLNWYNPPLSFLAQVTDPYLNIFRSFIPPLGGMDFSPMLAIFVLQIVSGLFSSAAAQAAAYLY